MAPAAPVSRESLENQPREDCWVCLRVFGRNRQATHSCHKCKRGFCEGEHGRVSDSFGTCVICAELEEHAYECQCGWLDGAMRDPHVPVGFDSKVNEYYIESRSEKSELTGHMPIYYCPFCGGAPPPSLRASLFEHITAEEHMRLNELTKNLRTVPEVLATFGSPDEDIPDGFAETTPEKEGQPARTIVLRVLRYQNLSSTALVDAIVHNDDRVSFSFITKPRAPREG
jgi:hypothetical protein